MAEYADYCIPPIIQPCRCGMAVVVVVECQFPETDRLYGSVYCRRQIQIYKTTILRFWSKFCNLVLIFGHILKELEVKNTPKGNKKWKAEKQGTVNSCHVNWMHCSQMIYWVSLSIRNSGIQPAAAAVVTKALVLQLLQDIWFWYWHTILIR